MISASTRRAKETASLNALRWYNKNDSSKGLVVVRRHAAKYVSRLNLCNIILSTVVRGIYFCRAGHYPGVHNLL